MDLSKRLDKLFYSLVKKHQASATQALVFSDKHKINYTYASDSVDVPFHVASIGKIMTATLVGIFAEVGKLNIDDKISKHLPSEILEELFVYKGTDYKDKVTIRNLLMHTSGVADYFDSKNNIGSKFVDIALADKDKVWTPEELVDFTRQNQSALSEPGKFRYSDTGYVLLGMLLEEVSKQQFHELLSKYIFKPLGMKDSYLLFGGQPENTKRQIAPVWLNGQEISQTNALSCDWAGGGIVSTLKDLLLFQKSFWNHELVSSDFIKEMQTIENKFHAGIHYGAGMMELRFEEFFFLFKGLPRMYGHSGVLSTALFYDPENDVHIILNLGSNKRIPASFRALITIQQLVKKNLDKKS